MILNVHVCTCVLAEVVDLSTMMEDTKFFLLLAKVQKDANRSDKAVQSLSNARDMQSRCVDNTE